jgi:hypothetical protein
MKIGAWWIGFLVLGFAILVFTIPMFMFPKRFKRASTKMVKNSTENEEEKEDNLSEIKIPKVKGSVFLKISDYICNNEI